MKNSTPLHLDVKPGGARASTESVSLSRVFARRLAGLENVSAIAAKVAEAQNAEDARLGVKRTRSVNGKNVHVKDFWNRANVQRRAEWFAFHYPRAFSEFAEANQARRAAAKQPKVKKQVEVAPATTQEAVAA